MPTLSDRYNGFVNGDSAASLTTAAHRHHHSHRCQSGRHHIDHCQLRCRCELQHQLRRRHTQGHRAAADHYGELSDQDLHAALPTLSVSYNGFVNGDSAASLTTAPTVSTTATAASPVGNYTTTASGAVDANYTISYVAGRLTVTPALPTITASSPTKIYARRC